MGYSSQSRTVLQVLAALEAILADMGVDLPRGAAAGAAERLLAG